MNSVPSAALRLAVTIILVVGVEVALNRAHGQSTPPDVAINIDWMAKPDNCGHPAEPKCRAEYYTYKHCCYLNPDQGLPEVLFRDDMSANEVVARAILTAIRHGDKYKAIAYLALGQCHNSSARDDLNNNKKAAYDYLMSNYADAFDNDDPEKYGGPGQAFKVGVVYTDDQLNGCVENDKISSVDVPPGLHMRVCDDSSGDPGKGDGCLDFGPGTHGLGKLNDETSYVYVSRQ